uniref:Uncharacterized protein n=1 Tax=Oryza brachyantha TaxID=4533 RepID=J3MS75_ORYBR
MKGGEDSGYELYFLCGHCSAGGGEGSNPDPTAFTSLLQLRLSDPNFAPLRRTHKGVPRTHA